MFNARGIFVLDQTHLVVPDNPHYQGAVRMPVDEHGQRYRNYEELTEEGRRGLKYHPCYSLSLLLHVDLTPDLFHIAGYEFGPGNVDELPQADKLVPDFCRSHPSLRVWGQVIPDMDLWDSCPVKQHATVPTPSGADLLEKSAP